MQQSEALLIPYVLNHGVSSAKFLALQICLESFLAQTIHKGNQFLVHLDGKARQIITHI